MFLKTATGFFKGKDNILISQSGHGKPSFPHILYTKMPNEGQSSVSHNEGLSVTAIKDSNAYPMM